MSFMKFLQGIGDRLGILESVSPPESAPAMQIRTRIISLRDLAGEIRSGEVKALADSSGELAAPFEKIFEAAGISSDGWTIAKHRQIIEKESEQKSREMVQKTVLDLLRSAGLSSEILVKDAIARDQALDAFEARVNEKMEERNKACKKRLLEMEEQIKSLQEESVRISENLKVDEEKWHEWKKGKRAYERELAATAAYLVDHRIVTTDEEDVGN